MDTGKIKEYLTWKWMAGAGCVLVLVVVLCVWIFSGDRTEKETGDVQAGPEQVLAGFYSSLVSGNVEEVKVYCDTLAPVMRYVQEYMEHIAEVRDEVGALSIVSDMIKTEVTDSKKGKDVMTADFRLTLENGTGGSVPKERTAELRMRDGQWIIVNITDR